MAFGLYCSKEKILGELKSGYVMKIVTLVVIMQSMADQEIIFTGGGGSGVVWGSLV
jgi:hypothetical protein